MYLPIENYGVIGDLRTVALVGLNGSIDWFCHPHFDSPSVFGAILDDKKGGRFRIAPKDEDVRTKQFYWSATNILVTRFFNEEGIVEMQDFMPMGPSRSDCKAGSIYRRVRGVRGCMRFRVECSPAFDYGRQPHQIDIGECGARFTAPSLSLGLSSSIPLKQGGRCSVDTEFSVSQGDTALFILQECPRDQRLMPVPAEPEAEDIFHETVHYWRSWLSACTYHGRWRDPVHRSALMLKLLTFQPTGAIVAAPTCSLPEWIGGERNWDYRYTWVRDAAFTVYGFLRIGFKEEAGAFIDWLTKFTGRDPQLENQARTLLTIH
jgi:GH15 family glucan-1,4-alpha-glucosidase